MSNATRRLQLDPLTPELTIVDLFRFVGSNWRCLAVGAVIGLILGAVGWATIPERFTASATLSPAQATVVPGGPLRQFASEFEVLGFRGGAEAVTERAIATLTARSFLEQFIADQKPVLMDGRSVSAGWMAKRITVTGPLKGLITLAVEWDNPDEAARIANTLATAVNGHLRHRALEEAGRFAEYLESKVATTTEQQLRDAMHGLILQRIQAQMVAQGTPEFAFIVIDPAYPPSKPSQPRPVLLMAGGLFAGLMLGLLFAAFVSVVRQARNEGGDLLNSVGQGRERHSRP